MLADPAEWQVDPWSGELRDGEIWGRGALDMKGQVAANAVAMASLAREGFEPAGDLIFVAAADEEVGDGFGLPWLCSEHPDAVRAEYSLNEGAGDRVELGDRVLYLCSTAEKMSSPFRASRPRPERACLDARDRRQRAREGGAADRAARRVLARSAARARDRGASSRPSPGPSPAAEALERRPAVDPLAASWSSRCSR